MPETSLPGQQGNVALAAHRNTFFGPLRRIHLGDIIVLKTAEASFLYQVESTSVVAPSNVQVLEASTAPTLTLITCFPFDYVGAAPQRFIVRAREIRATTDEVSIHKVSSTGRT
jgi:sortase A